MSLKFNFVHSFSAKYLDCLSYLGKQDFLQVVWLECDHFLCPFSGEHKYVERKHELATMVW